MGYINLTPSFNFHTIPGLNQLTVAVFCNILVILFCQEPAYRDILYGGTWKYVTINPSKDYTDVGSVEEKLRLYVQQSESTLGNHELNQLTCYALSTLLFSLSDREPLSFTQNRHNKDGTKYPVSIPITVGLTYHCEMTTSKENTPYKHYIAASLIHGEDQIFILSHIFFSLNYRNIEYKTPLSSLSDCEKQMSSSSLNIVSTLNKRKDLKGHVCNVKLELSKMQDHGKRSCRYTAFDNENNSTSVFRTELDVMTYNIWNFNPYFQNERYLERMNRLVKLVASADPDILGLQEVRLEASRGGKSGPSQMDHLMPHLKGYQYVFQPAQMFKSSLDDGRSEEGVAILSKYPIIYHEYLLLFRNTSNSADGHQRVCLHAVVDVPRIGQVHVFNTHYSLSHEAREEASKQILAFMALYEGPAILLGDLNAVPEEKAVRLLSKDSNLVDVWSLKHNDKPGYTFNTLESKLSKRIDYILLRKLPGVDVTDVRVMNDNARSNICSDHRAVQAKLSFKSCL